MHRGMFCQRHRTCCTAALDKLPSRTMCAVQLERSRALVTHQLYYSGLSLLLINLVWMALKGSGWWYSIFLSLSTNVMKTLKKEKNRCQTAPLLSKRLFKCISEPHWCTWCDMFLHYDEHGYCSLFWVDSTYIMLLLDWLASVTNQTLTSIHLIVHCLPKAKVVHKDAMTGSSSKWCYVCGFWLSVFWLYLSNTHCLWQKYIHNYWRRKRVFWV